MATDWTSSQLAAIETKDKTLLLSAAAGAGKTSTLTERIIRAITEKYADIGSMLIVTFTRASAADLKTKIYDALTKALAEAVSDEKLYTHLTEQLIKLGSAKISTIDAFYLSAVKDNFSKLGISSAFRIADNTETELLAKAVMSEVIEDFYDTVDDFPALCECFEKIRDKEDVMEGVLLSLYQECLYAPDGIDFVRICAEDCDRYASLDFLSSSFGKVLKNYLTLTINGFLVNYDNALKAIENEKKVMEAYYATLNNDRVFCVNAKLYLESDECTYAGLVDMFNKYEQQEFDGSVRGKDISENSLFCKDLRSKFKKAVDDVRNSYLCYSPTDMTRFFESTSKNLFLMHRALCAFSQRYSDEKKKRNILELSDVRRYAYDLFVDKDKNATETAKAYASQFTDIYIDEYQDVDPVQDLIFQKISTPTNRFMVGDIKQSIYSFRGAEPSLFAGYRSDFVKHGTPEAENALSETIFMSENFRCNKAVIDFTNLVCGRLFFSCKDSIGYTKEDDLIFPENKVASPDEPKVKVTVFAQAPKKKGTVSGQKKVSSKFAEAEYIATEIERLRKDDPSLKLSEIVVLYRSSTAIPLIEERLTAHGIKTSNSESTNYFQSPDVLMVLSILNAIDNPQRDIYLMGALKSPIFEFSVEDIIGINCYGEKHYSLYDKLCIAAEDDTELGRRCKDFNDTLCHMRDMSASLPIDKFLKYLFATDAFIASGLVCDKNASGEGGNLRQLYEYARTFETGSFKGLYSFIEFINSIMESGKTVSLGSKPADDDCVSIMSIHKAKGLERKVCFICNASGDLIKSPNNHPFCFDQSVGIAMHLSDSTGFAVYESPLFNLLVLNAELKQAEEEMRVLYVALTRAKQYLYITAADGKALCDTIKKKADLLSRLDDKYFILTAGSYIEWILSATCSSYDDSFEVSFFDSDNYPEYSVPLNVEQAEQTDIDQALYEKLREKFAFEYPYELLRRVPAKLSVSRLSPTALDDKDDAKDAIPQKKSPPVPAFFLPKVSAATAAERGTATHLFLQFCDFDFAAKHGAEETINMLVEKGFLPSNAGELIYKDEVQAMLSSDLMQKILSAKKIIREQRFNMLIPIRELTTDQKLISQVGDRTTAVQGVIDLIIIENDGSIGLYDYKTDRIKKEQEATSQLNKSHALQLSYYARAVEYLFGKKPDRVAVYSTVLAKLVDIDICALALPHDIL